MIRVGKQCFHPERASGGADLAIHGKHAAFARVSGAIRENELQLQLPGPFGAHGGIRKQSREIDVRLFGDAIVGLDGVNRRNRRQLATGGTDQIANLRFGDAGNALNGREDPGEFQI